MDRVEPVEIPAGDLDPETLRALAEAFVNREGTDYGAEERSLAQKVDDVLGQIHRGEARIFFDPETETTNLVPATELPDRSPKDANDG